MGEKKNIVDITIHLIELSDSGVEISLSSVNLIYPVILAAERKLELDTHNCTWGQHGLASAAETKRRVTASGACALCVPRLRLFSFHLLVAVVR